MVCSDEPIGLVYYLENGIYSRNNMTMYCYVMSDSIPYLVNHAIRLRDCVPRTGVITQEFYYVPKSAWRFLIGVKNSLKLSKLIKLYGQQLFVD